MRFRELLQKLRARAGEKNRTCYLCRGEVFAGETFCKDCRGRLPYAVDFCLRCGRRTKERGFCAECRARLPLPDKERSAFVYDGEVRRLIYAFKNGDAGMAEGLAREMLPVLEREFAAADLLTFVPMTERARRKRGYNQSERLARALSALCGIPVEEIFAKTRETGEQKSLSRAEREKNLHGAFHLQKRAVCRGKKILLVDDVMTTGSTADELARLLRGAHAEKVWLLTLAATPCPSPRPLDKGTADPAEIEKLLNR